MAPGMGTGVMVVGWLLVEEFFDGVDVVAAWAVASVADFVGEEPAVAALLAELAGATGVAFVDRVGSSRCGWGWQGGGGRVGVVASAVSCDSAGVGAVDAFPGGRERGGADGAGDRYMIVT